MHTPIGLKTVNNHMLGDNTISERFFIRTYKRRRVPSPPHMSEDIVLEILLRLPAKDLIRFQIVCKTWRAIIMDTRFIRSHLQHSAIKNKQSFLIVPYTLDSIIEDEIWPSTFSNNIPLYQWQKGHDAAKLLLANDFHGDFGSVYRMSHRDGLLLFLTDTKVYVINPATRDVLVLPDGRRDMLLAAHNHAQTVGFGLDPRTKKYKVARFFYRDVDILKKSYSMGMEIFTICGDDSDDCWRETAADPPYPITGVAAYFKGSLFWTIGSWFAKQSEKGFLRFHLEHETFSLIPQPASAFDGKKFQTMEQGEQLYLAQCQSPQRLVIWIFCDDKSHQWVQLYSIDTSRLVYLPTASMLHDGLFFHFDRKIFRCDMGSGNVKEVVCMDQLRYGREKAGAFECCSLGNVFMFNLFPYTESLVAVTRCDNATTHRLLV